MRQVISLWSSLSTHKQLLWPTFISCMEMWTDNNDREGPGKLA